MLRSACTGWPAYNDLPLDNNLDVGWSTNSTRAAATICPRDSFQQRFKCNTGGRDYVHLRDFDREDDLFPRAFVLQIDLTLRE